MFTALLSMVLGLGFGALSGFATGIEAMILASIFVMAMAVYLQYRRQSSQLSKGGAVAAVPWLGTWP